MIFNLTIHLWEVMIYVIFGLLTVFVNYIEIYNEDGRIVFRITDIALVAMIISWWPLVIFSKALHSILPEKAQILFTLENRNK